MKNYIVFMLAICLTQLLRAQSVGIGTTTPNAGAILDLSSTNKGLLLPRMTTAQRTAIVNPAQGLIVFDTDTQTNWCYNGTQWTSLVGTGITLPYSVSTDYPGDVFTINAAGQGAAIKGITTNEFGFAVVGIGNSAYGYGVFGTSTGANGVGVYGNTTNATAVKANSTTGIALDAVSTGNMAIKANILSGANANPVIKATHAGSGVAIEGSSSTGYGIKGVTSTALTNGAAIHGFNGGTQGSGVFGGANFASGYGVQGSSTTGTGVYGYSNSYRGVAGVTISGSALYGYSSSGYGLEVIGNLKISGGNTNPSAGAVLSCIDANGNAVWKPKDIGFKAINVHSSQLSLANQTFKKVYWATEQYDVGNDFNILVSGSPTATHSNFIVPVNGIYHFDVHVEVSGPEYIDVDDTQIRLRQLRGGVTSTIAQSDGTLRVTDSYFDYMKLSLSSDFSLQAGDHVWVEVYQRSGYTCTIIQSETLNQFSAYLLFGL